MIDRGFFSARFGFLRQDNGVNMVDVAKALNISKQSVHQWAAGKNVPSADTLVALADYFNVSVDYLIGRSDIPERAGVESLGITQPEFAMIEKARSLAPEKLQLVESLLNQL